MSHEAIVEEGYDLSATHAWLSAEAYWCKGIPLETLARALRGSICVSARVDGRQVGFARVVTDRATFAYLADVYVLAGHRGRGLASRLVGALRDHPELQGLRRWMLATRDAHELYRKLGWSDSPSGRLMEIVLPRPYG